jgi:5'-AMP-activated protein kinase regulatory gamma subunit
MASSGGASGASPGGANSMEARLREMSLYERTGSVDDAGEGSQDDSLSYSGDAVVESFMFEEEGSSTPGGAAQRAKGLPAAAAAAALAGAASGAALSPSSAAASKSSPPSPGPSAAPALEPSGGHGHPSGVSGAAKNDPDRIEGRRVIARFLKECSCYQIIPESCKVVVFDRNIPIRLSYYALVEHEIGAAPLWDPVSQRLSGIITTLDFIELLRYGHHTESVLEILDSHSVASWRSLVAQLCEQPAIADSLVEAGMPAVAAASMAAEYERGRGARSQYLSPERADMSVSPDCTLFEACWQLKDKGVHWLPIVDDQEQVCIGVVTHLAVLQYLVTNFSEERRLFEQPICQLGIGTFSSNGSEIVTATLDTPVHDVLDLLSLHRVSCVPIVSAGQPIAVYSRTNVIDLVSHNSVESSLDLSLGSLLFGAERYKPGDAQLPEDWNGEMPERMRVQSCRVTDSLQQVFVKFAEVKQHSLLYVDDEGRLQGIVSLSDLLAYFST